MQSTPASRNEVLCKVPLARGLEDLKLPAALSQYRSAWSLTRALAWSRAGNPRASTGRGSRRRSCHEHQLDRLLALLRATQTRGAVVTLPNRQAVEPWALLRAPLPCPAPAIVAYRARIELILAWALAQHPRTGWARPQSRHRALDHEHATEYNLPARSRPAFYFYRRAVRQVIAMLAILHVWWDRLCPAHRSPAVRTQDERPGSEARTRTFDPERSAGHSGTRRLADVVPHVLPRRAM